MENILEGKENIRHKFSRARVERGNSWRWEIKKLIEKAIGFWLVLGGPSIKMS